MKYRITKLVHLHNELVEAKVFIEVSNGNIALCLLRMCSKHEKTIATQTGWRETRFVLRVAK